MESEYPFFSRLYILEKFQILGKRAENRVPDAPSSLQSPLLLTPPQDIVTTRGFPGGSEGKESACNVGDLGSIPGSGRSPGEGNGNPLQYCCLENSMDRGAWWAAVHEVLESCSP